MTNQSMESYPELNDVRLISEEQKTSYQEKGHTVVRKLAKQEEIKSYRDAIKEMVVQETIHSKPLHERDTYGKAFLQVINLWTRNKIVERFVTARRFAAVAAQLMGVDGVRIYHDQALFKEAGGGFTPWHQDQIYWPMDTPNTITMWMPLVNVPDEMGTMSFASGLHNKGFISKAEISDESHKNLQEFIQNKGIEQVTYGAMSAGDASFHSGWTPHCAPGNPTEQYREVMTVIYIADGTVISKPDSKPRENDLKSWFPGLKPGDLAASPINPLVYKKSQI